MAALPIQVDVKESCAKLTEVCVCAQPAPPPLPHPAPYFTTLGVSGSPCCPADLLALEGAVSVGFFLTDRGIWRHRLWDLPSRTIVCGAPW